MSKWSIPQHPVSMTDASFSELGLGADVLGVVDEAGYTHPTPIQAAALPVILTGADLIGLAETGSGKTAAFVLPMVERLEPNGGFQGLIVCPTREIALQTEAFLELFGEGHLLRTACLIGGVSHKPQLKALNRKPHVIVATPGRFLDHMRRGRIPMKGLRMLVLDEADHMLDMGFLPQIRAILEAAPEKRQTLMFSATMPPAIERLAQRFMHEPQRVDILPVGGAAEGIQHRLYLVREKDRKPCLLALLHQELGSTLVFIRRKIDAEWLCKVLEKEGHDVARIHSDRSQGERVEALDGFREGQHRILVATDIAGRGIDVPHIRHIVNFDLPEQVEDYIHRAGRTARGRSGGLVSSIATWRQKAFVKELEATLGETLPRCTVPGVEPYVELSHRPRVRRRLL